MKDALPSSTKMAQALSGFLYLNGRPLNRKETRTSQQILSSLPKGAYTSFRIEQFKTVLNWNLHLQRLQRSVTLLTEHDPATYPSQRFDPTKLEAVVSENVQLALEDVRLNSEEASDQMVVVLLSHPENDTVTPCDVYTYVRHTSDIGIHAKPIQVWVKGRGREVPEAKYSKWVTDRIPLEQAKPKDCQEVILVNDQGGLLEGLTSTLYVIKRNSDGHEIQTAGLKDGVLIGIFRKTVLDVAAQPEFHLRLNESCPLLSASASWIETFISNSLTGIRPISKMIMAEGNKELVFDAPGEWTSRLMKATDAAHERTNISKLHQIA